MTGQLINRTDGFTESYGFTSQIQAEATDMDGFTIRNDFMPAIREFIRKELFFWPLLVQKEPAEGDLIREAREVDLPPTGFFNKHNFSGLLEHEPDYPSSDTEDPGQVVKAGGALFKVGHYAKSLYIQQGRQFGDVIAKKTTNLIQSTAKTLERTLFTGNTRNNHLEFNGIGAQMAPGHAFTCDIRPPQSDSIVRKLRGIVRLAMNHPDITRSVTHIFTSGLGLQLIEDETDNKLIYTNRDEIRPGLKVAEISTQAGNLPIINSPFLTDANGGGDLSTGVGQPDIVTFWLIDINQILWKGVYPDGGTKTFDPQIFEVSTYTDATMQYLVEKRLCLFYGTLYCTNRGEGIWRLDVTVPAGTVGSI